MRKVANVFGALLVVVLLPINLVRAVFILCSKLHKWTGKEAKLSRMYDAQIINKIYERFNKYFRRVRG